MSNSQHDVLHWLWLSLCCSPGSSAGDILLEYFDSDAKKIYESSADDLAEMVGKVAPEIITRLLNKDVTEAEEIKMWCEQNNVGLLPIDSPLYPKRLLRIQKKPILLYYRGKLPIIDEEVCITMVGTRRMTDYGQKQSYILAADMASAGAIVVSGLALGVDSLAHRGSLDAGGHTIAILGCGIDQVYPPSNKPLYDEVLASGTLITEFKPFTSPHGVNFPIRNRIMSGISLGTIVIEADLKSGALITARSTIMQGRTVFALPGKVGETNSTGTLRLIKEGAKPVTEASDILDEYQFLYPNKIFMENLPLRRNVNLSPKAKDLKVASDSHIKYREEKDAATRAEIRGTSSPEPAPVPPVQPIPPTRHAAPAPTASPARKPMATLEGINKQIYDMLSTDTPTAADDIAKTGLSINAVLASLTILEIKGMVKPVPGGKYIKIV